MAKIKRGTAARASAAKSRLAKRSAPLSRKSTVSASAIDFNHAMIYCRDVERSLAFYTRHFGFKAVDQFRYEGKPVYARLVAPAGNGTIALHQAAPGAPVTSDGVRLYFEIRDLDMVCEKLKRAGVYFSQMPQMMPWGWRHAYLDDPDNHEISLYWAGPNRLEKTVMKAAKEASKVPKAKRTR
jgi:catechol 2,3-dioxygenase-like lactoylglutathione lyase family enzyme